MVHVPFTEAPVKQKILHLRFESIFFQLLHFPLFLLILQVSEIISVLRQAGKSSARNDDASDLSSRRSSGGSGSSETGAAAPSAAPATTAPADIASATAFAKRFEVLFCGRLTVPHKNAPPALIDECVLKLSHLQSSESSLREGDTSGARDGLKTLAAPSNGFKSRDHHDGSTGDPPSKHPVLFKRDPSFPCLRALDENGLSPEISQAVTADSHISLTGVRPSSQQENRTMLFMVIFKLHTHITGLDF